MSMQFELLAWTPADHALKPDMGETVLVRSAAGLAMGYWDAIAREWINEATSGVVIDALRWARPNGGGQPLPAAPADLRVDQVQAALLEACILVRGWVDWKCALKHKAEHRAVITALLRAGGLS